MVRPGAVEPAVAEDDAPEAEDGPFELLLGRPSGARELPGDALGEETRRSGALGRGQQDACALPAHSRVRVARVCEVRLVVRKVGELVHDELRPERRDPLPKGCYVVHVADDGLGSERSEPLGLLRRAGHARDDVPVRDEERHQPHAEHPARAREEDAHCYSVAAQRSQRTSSSSASRRCESRDTRRVSCGSGAACPMVTRQTKWTSSGTASSALTSGTCSGSTP